jgi:hypothetical protein
MTETLVKILVELLSTLTLATKQIRQGRPSKSCDFRPRRNCMTQCDAEKFVKKLFGEKDIEAVVQRLDRLTLDEARMTADCTADLCGRLWSYPEYEGGHEP